MTDADPSESAASSPDVRVREEWKRLERRRLDDELAEAREDATAAGRARRGPHWLVWLALVLAFAAGVAFTAFLNGFFDPTR